MNVLRAAAVEQSRQMIDVLGKRWPGGQQLLHENAVAALDTWPEVQLREVPDSQANERCSVAGGYVSTTQPPTLTVTRSHPRRRQFTALHELGHHLQRTNAQLAVAVRRQPADYTTFEDAACDAFAGRVLIPDGMLVEVLTERSPTARDLATLYERTQASRAACCVRVAERLGSPGFAAVLTAQGVVTFAVGKGDVFPPARGTSQASTPLIAKALHGYDAEDDATYVVYRTGSTSGQLYGQAVWCGDYLLAVAVLDHAGWKAFSPPRVGPGRFVSRRPWCDVCQEEFISGEPCRACGQPRCPSGHCSCTLTAERMCRRCYLVKHGSQFPSVAAQVCTECSE